jgi:hypothetical protein
MKTGGYRDNSNSSMDIDLSGEVQDTSGEAPAPDAVAAAAESEPSTPVIQDTSAEIQETGQFDVPPTVTETALNADEDKRSLNTDSEPVTNELNELSKPVVDNAPVEISEELHLKYLSEKLGREVTGFDELIKTESNPLDSDPYLKELAEWRDKTGRPIEDWIKFQKDYTTVSDADIAREFLQIEFPELTQDEIELEVSQKFLSSEDDFDNEIAIKNLELKKYASRGRKELNKLVSDLGNPNPANLTPEHQQDLAIAKEYKELKAQSVVDNKAYNETIANSAAELKTIKLNLAENVSLDYRLPDNYSGEIVKMIQEAPHWKNEDGSWNHQAIVKDAAIVQNMDKMLQLAYEQGRSSGADTVVRETKNITLDKRGSNESAIPQGNSGVQIEGLDNYLGNKGMKIIRGR